MCKCGCNICRSAPILNESKQYIAPISENMRYHLVNRIPIHENIFRPGSKSFIDLIHETRVLWNKQVIKLNEIDKKIFELTDIGYFGMYEGKIVPLDLPFMDIDDLNEAEFKGKEVQLGKPKRGGSKKFYVYVKNPKTKKIMKVSFGDTTGLRAKLNNPKARKAFAARHDCANKKDRTKASYWSCRLPRMAKLLGFKTTYTGYW